MLEVLGHKIVFRFPLILSGVFIVIHSTEKENSSLFSLIPTYHWFHPITAQRPVPISHVSLKSYFNVELNLSKYIDA